jgi:hypothetical protein
MEITGIHSSDAGFRTATRHGRHKFSGFILGMARRELLEGVLPKSCPNHHFAILFEGVGGGNV